MQLWSIAACLRTFVAAIATARPEARALTLGQIRADLSHEMAAKMARLSGIFDEWRAGRFRDEDALDTMTIISDIEVLHLRHARVAVATIPIFGQLTRVIATIDGLRSSSAKAAREQLPTSPAMTRAAARLESLNRESRRLTEMISVRHAVRVADLVGQAADEIRREYAAGQDLGIPMAIEDSDHGTPTWVLRADAARWVDILRNLIRNAMQSVIERNRQCAPVAGQDPRSVAIRVMPANGVRAACIEVIDDGIGMSDEQAASMWLDGVSRNGGGHGHGLTQDKRAFLERNCTLEVRTSPDIGTCIRMEIVPREIAIRLPHRWAAPPVAIPIAIFALVVVISAWRMRHLEMVSVRVTDEQIVEALDNRGHVLWHRRMPERVMPNYRSIITTESPSEDAPTPQLVVQDEAGKPLAILSTITNQGPGHVFAVDSKGIMRWIHPLYWTAPKTVHANNLISAFQAETIWSATGERAIVLNVRDRNWSSTSVQFLDLSGVVVGEYLHPGHVEFVASADFDGDGRTEVLLSGKNNDATHGTDFWPGENLSDAYGECLIMLETTGVAGQAFPYRRWQSIPAANEEAYLLIPPLREADFANPRSTQVTRASVGRPAGEGKPCIEISIADGRIYVLDQQLRPLTCSVGDHTPAALNTPALPAAKLLYLNRGIQERIDLEVHGGT